MLEKSRSKNLNERFQESVKALDRVTRRAQLIRKIDLSSRKSENATPEELMLILNELKAYREQIKLLDREEAAG